VAATCTGTSAPCPANTSQPDNTPCVLGGDPCAACSSGTCTSGALICASSAACDPTTGCPSP
jgi:hypothetical protein